MLLATIAIVGVRPARAQVVPSVDAGTSSIAYGDNPPAGLFLLTPSVRYLDSRVRLTATGTLASGALYGITSRGTVEGTFSTPPVGPLRFEIGGSSGWNGLDPSVVTGWWCGEARARLDRRASGVWLSAGAGRALNASTWHTVISLASGAWLRIGGITFAASLEKSRALDVDSLRNSRRRMSSSDTAGPFFGTVSDSNRGPAIESPGGVALESSGVRDVVSQTDAQVALQWERGPLQLELSIGRRFAHSANAGVWGGGRARFWLSNRIALIAGGGTLPSRLTEGYAASRYMTFGLHLSRRPAPPSAASPHAGAATRTQTGIQVGALYRGKRSVSIRVPATRSVEIMADFTNWMPIGLTRDATGAWVVQLPITPGTHRINMRVDGGAWGVPPGLAVVCDDFNGTTGLLIVS